MAFNFLGTLSKKDLEALRSYLQGELDNADALINNTLLEVNKLQKTSDLLDEFAAKTNTAIKWFGKTFDRRTSAQYDDADAAIDVQIIKEPYYQNIKVKENLEHKMRKIRDAIEQGQERVYNLRISKSEFDTNFEKVSSLFDGNRIYLTVEQDATDVA